MTALRELVDAKATLPIVVDIETVPTEAALAEPYPRDDRSPPSNWKDEAKIAQWYVDDEAKWKAERVKECSTNPRLGRVLCIGYSLPCSDGPVYSVSAAWQEGDEAHILKGFWENAALHGGRIVGFNSRGFDLRWIVLRSLAHGLQPTIPVETVRAWFARYVVRPHCDVRDLLTNWDQRESGTLEEWCRFVGVPYENGVKGSNVYGLYKAGKFSEIAAHCRADVVATRELYQRVARSFVENAASVSGSALPRMYWPEDEGLSIEELREAVEEGRACIECGGEWATEYSKAPVICTVCANTYLTKLLDTLGYTLRRGRGRNAEGHARIACERKAKENR